MAQCTCREVEPRTTHHSVQLGLIRDAASIVRIEKLAIVRPLDAHEHERAKAKVNGQ